MAERKKGPESPPTGQANRAKLSAEESLKRMEEFPERKARFFAAETQVPSARDVVVTEDALTVSLADGRTLSVPLTWYPRLWHGTPEERAGWRLIGDGQGIHWPGLDEDISVEGLFEGRRSVESQRSLKQWLEQRPAVKDWARRDADSSSSPEPG
jgi:Protein of unknown function (DUF2442)